MIEPRLLNHVKCLNCKATFNSKTGKSNNAAIVAYMAVIFLIAVGIFFAVWMAQ